MKKRQQNLSYRLTHWIGSSQSVVFHTIFFIGIFALYYFGVSLDDILLLLTTIVSLEAIYLAIFIQMTINEHSVDLDELQEDVEEISEDIEEIQEDVGELQEDVEELNEESEIEEDTELSRFEYIEHKLQSLLTELQDIKKHTTFDSTKKD